MSDNTRRLIEKLNCKDHLTLLDEVSFNIDKVEIDPKLKVLNVSFDVDETISKDAYLDLKQSLEKKFSDLKINLKINPLKVDDDYKEVYYQYFLTCLCEKYPLCVNFSSSLKDEIIVCNDIEKKQVEEFLKELNELLSLVGYGPLEVKISREMEENMDKLINEKFEKARNNFKETPPKIKVEKPKKKFQEIPIKEIKSPRRNIQTKGYLIDISLREFSGKDFTLLSGEIIDEKDSIVIKKFINNDEVEDYKALKKGDELVIQGSVSKDKYENDNLVFKFFEYEVIGFDEEKATKNYFEEISKDSRKMINLTSEEENLVVEGEIFKFELRKFIDKGFALLLLKIYDKTSSISAKKFIRNMDEANFYEKNLREKDRVRIFGDLLEDKYENFDLTLTIKTIQKLEKEVLEEVVDDAPIKRVELNAHTFMSSLNGAIGAVDLIKRVKALGHKGLAICDIDGCQAFPEIYNLTKKWDDFKMLYGTNLVMVEDDVVIVEGSSTTEMLEETFVVFDTETTGFNAGAGDQMIEIGAVKMKKGKIIDRFSELINPKRALSETIVKLTGITDDDLKDKRDEKEVVISFKEWIKDLPLVAHNAQFDKSFLSMAYEKYDLGPLTNPIVDTLELSRFLDSGERYHNLSTLVKRYDVDFDENSHHRADYDAEATAAIFHKMIMRLANQDILKLDDLVDLGGDDIQFGEKYDIVIIAKNQAGLKNLFTLISLAETKYLNKKKLFIPRSEVEKYRDNLFIGSVGNQSEVFKNARTKTEVELMNHIDFYDFIGLEPISTYEYLIDLNVFSDGRAILELLKKIYDVSKRANKLVVATASPFYFDKEDVIYREILAHQKLPTGGLHPLNRKGIKHFPNNYFRTTKEMSVEYPYLEDNEKEEIIITNTNKIFDEVEKIEVIPETHGKPFAPKMKNSAEIVKKMVYDKAESLYGTPLPEFIKKRVDAELDAIIGGGFDVIYYISQKLVEKSESDGYLVGSRGSVGSSIVATFMGITEVNPLPAHYRCSKCKMSIFEEGGVNYSMNYSSGFDLPDKDCPKCKIPFIKDGQDMPFAVFLGFDGTKVPDIDLNFSSEYQSTAHDYTKELFGEDNVFRAGTILTVQADTGYGFVKGYLEDKDLIKNNAEIERLAQGLVGAKRSSGAHAGGILVLPDYKDISDVTPIQYPAQTKGPWRTTHFDFHAIEEVLLKLDILGHDDPTMLRILGDLSGIDVKTIPVMDEKVLSLLISPEAMGIDESMIKVPTGTLGLPELGTKLVINMLDATKPKTFGELVKISGLSHGEGIWKGNAEDLINENVVPFKNVIGCRDDIMINLMNYGVKDIDAFNIMEFVRKGKPSKQPEKWESFVKIMEEANVPDWYIKSCQKIKYMFPKAHATAYVLSALRIAWFKVYKPLLYYAAYFSVRASRFDVGVASKGYNAVNLEIERLENIERPSAKEKEMVSVLELVREATARGVQFSLPSLSKSDAKRFVIDEETNAIIPPFGVLDGLGANTAINIIKEREKKFFTSVEDLQDRGKVSSTIIEVMKTLGVLDELPESNQLSLF